MRLRTASAAVAATLGLAITAPVGALADSSSSAAPVVTQSAPSFTVELPGVGSLTFTVDPATGAVSNLVATADSGFTAGPTQTTDEGVQVSFLDASGAPTLLQAEVDQEDGTVKVKPEVNSDDEGNTTTINGTGDESNEAGIADDEANEDHAGQTTAGQQNEANDANEKDGSEDGKAPAMNSSAGSSTTASSPADTEGGGSDDGGTNSGTPTTTTTVGGGQTGASTSSDGGSGRDASSGDDSGHDGGSGDGGGSN